MSAARNYPNGMREQEPGLSLTAAGPGGADTLRGWCKRAEIDTGRAPRGSNTRSGHTPMLACTTIATDATRSTTFWSRSGDVAAIEINASTSLDTASRRALTNLRIATTNRFRAGIVLYTGRHRIPLGDRP